MTELKSKKYNEAYFSLNRGNSEGWHFKYLFIKKRKPCVEI